MLFTHMVEQDTQNALTVIFKAASDPTRRAILSLLARHGPLKVTAIAGQFDLSLNAISKHIKVLETARLVSRRTEWRDHLIALEIETLREVDRWFDDLRSIWALRLDALDDLLTETETAT